MKRNLEGFFLRYQHERFLRHERIEKLFYKVDDISR